MDNVSVAQSRLEVVRAVGDIPRYMNPERGFATNIMFGPPAVDPKLIAELDKYRKNTDGARDKMNRVKATLAGRKVAEVPTTWRDRTAGESNFKLRKWLPHYLRWYLLALRARLTKGRRAPTAG